MIGWVFALPGRARANFLLLRNTRVYLPEAEARLEPLEVARAVGRLYDPEAEALAIEAPAGPMEITTDPQGYANPPGRADRSHQRAAVDRLKKTRPKDSTTTTTG